MTKTTVSAIALCAGVTALFALGGGRANVLLSGAYAYAAPKSQSNTRTLKFGAKKQGKFSQGKRIVVELTGEAFVETEDMRLEAGRITVSTDEKSDLEIRATVGRVRMQMRSARLNSGPAAPAVVTCSQAVYQSSQRKVTMEGPVNVKMDAISDAVIGGDLKGEKAEIDLDDPEGMRITIENIEGTLLYRESPKSAVKNGDTGKEG